ncbi:hypothetical protein ABKN59_011606 [Abortiporus biennis]
MRNRQLGWTACYETRTCGYRTYQIHSSSNSDYTNGEHSYLDILSRDLFAFSTRLRRSVISRKGVKVYVNNKSKNSKGGVYYSTGCETEQLNQGKDIGIRST